MVGIFQSVMFLAGYYISPYHHLQEPTGIHPATFASVQLDLPTSPRATHCWVTCSGVDRGRKYTTLHLFLVGGFNPSPKVRVKITNA